MLKSSGNGLILLSSDAKRVEMITAFAKSILASGPFKNTPYANDISPHIIAPIFERCMVNEREQDDIDKERRSKKEL